jgi:hypothetical protein
VSERRSLLDEAMTTVVRRLKERASSSYYNPSGRGSPWESAKLAADEADAALARAEDATWETLCGSVSSRLNARLEAFRANDCADPDGYVCNALRELIGEVDRCRGSRYEETARRMSEAAQNHHAERSRSASKPPRWMVIAFGALATFPVAVFILFWALMP